MKKILFPILALILFACSSNTPAPEPINVTVISQMTVTLTATLTPTSTVMPTITFTPPAAEISPEVMGALEAAPQPVTEFFAALGEGWGATLNKEGLIEIANCPGMTIDPETGKTLRTYNFEMSDGKVIPLTTRGQVGEDVTAQKDADGKTRVDTSAWRCNENGQWERMKVLDPEGKETEFPKYSKMESMVMMLAETLKIKNPNWKDPNSPERREFSARVNHLLDVPGFSGSEYEGMEFPREGGVGVSKLYIVDGNGDPVKDENGNIVKKPVIFFSYEDTVNTVNTVNTQSIMAWKSEDGETKKIVLDAKLGSIEYYGQHGGVGPFAMTQEEYDAIMASLTLGE